MLQQKVITLDLVKYKENIMKQRLLRKIWDHESKLK